MSGNIIKVKNVSKEYTLGQSLSYRTIGETVSNLFKFPSGKSKIESSDVGNDRKFLALDNISFEVNRGDIVGIIGRNGAGKSTLLKILSRITSPSKGNIEIHGRVGSLLEVGTGFHPELTGRENIYLSGSILGMKRYEINDKFDQIVKFSEIEQFLDTPVKRYSSGMYVRLAFAVAAHLEPEILIIDEVLSVGDAKFQKKCLGKMNEVSKEGRTILFVSHYMNAIEQLCSSCMLLEKGKMIRYDPDVKDVIKEYVYDKNSEFSSKWENLSNEFNNPWFKPLKLYLADLDNQNVSLPVRNDEDVWLYIKGECFNSGSDLVLGYAIYTQEGQLLYWSLHTDVYDEGVSNFRKGHQLLRSKIPKKFFNEGTYKIELLGGIHGVKWFFEPGGSVPSIILEIRGGLSNSPYWLSRRPGILAPEICWENLPEL
jgi:lipopolysaccharide transport system ATP-binding protein